MASKSRSGTNPHQRVAFLREHGYEPLENGAGKGSHQVWVHPDMAALMRTHKISMPENLRAYNQQQPCNVMLCSNPAGGTWKGIVAQVEWCTRTLEKFGEEARILAERRQRREELRSAIKEVTEWKRSIRSMFTRPAMVSKQPETPRAAMKLVQMNLMSR